jgi:protein-S-isoprenylcysteine O-methyltransferase Ste14
MLWIRGLIFSVLVPGVVAFVLPSAIDPGAHRAGGIWDVGLLPIAAGAVIYLLCLMRFLAAGGTPAIFFTRPIRFLLGEEPGGLVSEGLYRFSRNPMYAGVILAILGQAILWASVRVAAYGCAAFLFFHLVVVCLEEPHLRRTRGPSYELYCRTVPRWL